jgi:hydrogenase maturation protein HypF
MGERARLRIQVSGAVQGVGFRPFVYRLARSLGLGGWVRNTPAGVRIEAEGDPAALRDLLLRLRRERPPAARIRRVAHRRLPPRAGPAGPSDLPGDFEIRQSRRLGPAAALITPDLATCADCLRELFDPADRCYRYPFLNCTRCGPRYSIIESLPYDRPRTTMRAFRMCPRCQAEYDDPRDRRFHAQPTACPACGPALALWGPDGERRAVGDAALGQAAEALRAGAVVAVKGLGGFHLLVDACDEQAVRRLRRRKARPDKPLALMFPDLGQVRARCRVTRAEARLLRSRAAPIVLLRRRAGPGAAPQQDDVAQAVAPGPHSQLLGAMLPYTPLHHLLLRDLGRPLVATSGNRAGEPLCIDERQALDRLAGIADLFLVHDRPIARPVDDSVARVVAGRPLICRRARGYAPLPVALPGGRPCPRGCRCSAWGRSRRAPWPWPGAVRCCSGSTWATWTRRRPSPPAGRARRRS